MMLRFLIGLFLILGSSALALADDLYQVEVKSQGDIEALAEYDTRVIHQGHNHLLILLPAEQARQLQEGGLELTLLRSGVESNRLVSDARRDDVNRERFEILYEEGSYRLYLLSEVRDDRFLSKAGLMPVGKHRRVLNYQPAAIAADPLFEPLVADLDSLIALVSVDSLWAYLNHLQSYAPRVAGSLANIQSREWLKDKFIEFGYDSVMLDPFDANISGSTIENYNVLAYKIGTKYPDHHVIVGAHRDAVAGSPGADDNGSGTVGVLEIARLLKDVETEMTFVFALFDAEEFGLYGSWHYAERALAEGEEIVYMLNMDMIGYQGNSDRLNLFYGSDMTYSQRLGKLADSLLGLTPVYAGISAGSDHYPFTQLGYQATFVAEEIFSTVYHSYQDSTTYINPYYMAQLVQVSLATTYWVSQTQGPAPTLAFDYPAGLPEMVEPLTSSTFEVGVSELWEGVALPGSGLIYYSIDGAPYSSTVMTELSQNLYQAQLPGGECFSQIDYYVSVEEEATGLVFDPDPAEPNRLIVADSQVVSIIDNFETDLGWTTATTAPRGQWQRGVPVNDPGWKYDPMADGDGSGQCFLTQNAIGNTDVDDGWVSLTSPEVDFSDGGDIFFYYYLQLTNENGNDRLLIEANDGSGSGWKTIGMLLIGNGLFWSEQLIDETTILAAGLTRTSTMQVRFTANDGDPQSIVEAGIDGFRLGHYVCRVGCCGAFTEGLTGNTDCTEDGKINLADITLMIDRVYVSKTPLCCEENGNVDGDPEAKLNLSDITRLIDHVYVSKDPTAACQ